MKIEKEDLTPEQKWEQAGLENGFIFYHVFDVELQMRNTKELSERARYYQSLMDVDTL